MKLTLRHLIREAIHASPEYMKQEETRERIQRELIGLIVSGTVRSQKDVDRYFWFISDTQPGTELALTALRSIPFQVWQKLASS